MPKNFEGPARADGSKIEKIDPKLIKRAEELLAEYQPTDSELSSVKPHGEYEVDRFYYDDCREIPAIEIGEMGNSRRSEFKVISDAIYLYARMVRDYEDDEMTVYILDREQAKKVLKDGLDILKRDFDDLKTNLDKATEVLGSMK